MFANTPLADLIADWKVIRRAADAVAEVVDDVVNTLVEEYELTFETEELEEQFYDHIYALVTTGKEDQ